MQTFTHGAYRAKLTPTRNVGEFAAKLAKCNGKSRRLPLRDLRTKAGFPVFKPGMSTAEYVRLYSSGDGSQLKAWEWAQLNEEPCTLYSGEDTCETLPDGFDTWDAFDARDVAAAAPETPPVAPIECAAPVAPETGPGAPGAAVVSDDDANEARAIVEEFYDFHFRNAPGETVPVEKMEEHASAKRAPVYAPDAPMSDPSDIGAALRRGLDRIPYHHLPLFARVAIERLDADSSMRNSATLARMVEDYARTYGTAPDDSTRASAHYIAGRRFWDFSAAPDDAHGLAGCAKREGIEPAAPTDPAPAAAAPVAAAPVAPPAHAFPDPVATHSEPEKALPYAGFDPVRGAVYRAHIETAKHSRAIDPTFSGMLRRPRSAGFMVDFMAPEVRAHRNAIAAMVRACRAKRASVPLPADTGPLTTDTGADLGEQSAHRIGRESFERGEAMMSDASLRRAFGSQAERDAYYRGYDDAERAARPAPATHSEPAPARPVYANDHLAWADVERDRSDPDEYQARVIECFGEVKAGGLFYNSDTYPATAALMTARYGYPDWRGDRGQSDGVQDPFGMDCYRANSVIRARAERERERSAAATFTVGQRFARLIFNDGKQRTAAELVTLDPAGFACKLKAKSGRNSVEVTCSAYALSMAVIRAEERGKVLAAKRASARPEPIAPRPAEPAPVPGKSEPAADPFDAWHAAPNDPKPTFGAYSYAKRTGRTVIAYCGGGRIQSCAKAAGMRYVHRAKGFVGTPRQAEKMRAAWLAGAMRNAERAKDGVAEPGSLRAMLESLAVPTHAPLPGDTKPEARADDETIPAPLDGLDVVELGDDGMAEFEQAAREQATAPAYRELTTAHYRPQGPCLRIPAFDARAMIPQRFAPVYLLRA